MRDNSNIMGDPSSSRRHRRSPVCAASAGRNAHSRARSERLRRPRGPTFAGMGRVAQHEAPRHEFGSSAATNMAVVAGVGRSRRRRGPRGPARGRVANEPAQDFMRSDMALAPDDASLALTLTVEDGNGQTTDGGYPDMAVADGSVADWYARSDTSPTCVGMTGRVADEAPLHDFMASDMAVRRQRGPARVDAPQHDFMASDMAVADGSDVDWPSRRTDEDYAKLRVKMKKRIPKGKRPPLRELMIKRPGPPPFFGPPSPVPASTQDGAPASDAGALWDDASVSQSTIRTLDGAEQGDAFQGDPAIRYEMGQELVSKEHSISFKSASQASALLLKLPLDSPLFVKRTSGGWTYAKLADRKMDDQGRVSLVVHLKEGGWNRKILEWNKWDCCLRFVRGHAVSEALLSIASTARRPPTRTSTVPAPSRTDAKLAETSRRRRRVVATPEDGAAETQAAAHSSATAKDSLVRRKTIPEEPARRVASFTPADLGLADLMHNLMTINSAGHLGHIAEDASSDGQGGTTSFAAKNQPFRNSDIRRRPPDRPCFGRIRRRTVATLPGA